ncbi:hypothetical protein DM02DRAFT_206826 [Periconia macrospinosa]|uniref:Uncharacterized protein n=1 Tax=Periconia macrospinosa TaxID=97972 RepID=A0A2V1D7E9_9PLEO|nr:hypothetical protein DM02DRAFT_206826 [Periconia macrospinosa]
MWYVQCTEWVNRIRRNIPTCGSWEGALISTWGTKLGQHASTTATLHGLVHMNTSPGMPYSTTLGLCCNLLVAWNGLGSQQAICQYVAHMWCLLSRDALLQGRANIPNNMENKQARTSMRQTEGRCATDGGHVLELKSIMPAAVACHGIYIPDYCVHNAAHVQVRRSGGWDGLTLDNEGHDPWNCYLSYQQLPFSWPHGSNWDFDF